MYYRVKCASKKICYALQFELIFGEKSSLILYYWLNKWYDLLLLTLQRWVEVFFLSSWISQLSALRKKNSIRIVRFRNLIQWSDFEASNFSLFCRIALEVVYWLHGFFRKLFTKNNLSRAIWIYAKMHWCEMKSEVIWSIPLSTDY